MPARTPEGPRNPRPARVTSGDRVAERNEKKPLPGFPRQGFLWWASPMPLLMPLAAGCSGALARLVVEEFQDVGAVGDKEVRTGVADDLHRGLTGCTEAEGHFVCVILGSEILA